MRQQQEDAAACQGWLLRGILLERDGAGRQLNPRMPAAIVDGHLGRREAGVGKRADGDADAPAYPFFGVEQIGAADRAEAENEPGPLIAGADILGSRANDLVGSGKAGQGSEHAAGSLLASKAVAESDAGRRTLDFNA